MNNPLRRCTLLCTLLLSSLLFASCSKELDMPLGKWVLTNHNDINGNAMTLEFGTDNSMYIDYANEEIPPFDESNEWTYRLDKDSVLNISYEYYTYDGEYYQEQTVLYNLPLSFSNGERTLTLQYEEFHFFKPNVMHTYTFVRR